MIDIDKALASAAKTGKVSYGANAALLNAKTGKAKMIVLAANCPQNIKDEIEYYAKLSKVPTLTYKGDSRDLANVCAKPFIISVLSIREPGDSEILKAVEMQYYENEAKIGGTK